MKRIIKYLHPFLPQMGVGFTIKVLGTVVELLIPYILSHILKNVVVTQSAADILFWGGAMIVCASLALLFNIIANRMAARVPAVCPLNTWLTESCGLLLLLSTTNQENTKS